MTSPENLPENLDERPTQAERQKRVTEAAERALTEASERRKARDDAAKSSQPREKGGRDGPDPARYGDWEKDGIASDF